MGKITAEIIQNFLVENQIEFYSTHQTLCLPIINRIYHKMMFGIKFDEIKIYKNLIIDGHHRYISSLLAGIKIEFIKSYKTSATVLYEWKNVEFVDEEWDTPFKINQLNKIDAEFNNIDIEKLIEISK